jgi:hypothetical protein
MLSFLSCVSLLIPCQALGREKTFPADVHEPARKLLVLLHIGLDIEKISLFFPVGREKCGFPSGAGGLPQSRRARPDRAVHRRDGRAKCDDRRKRVSQRLLWAAARMIRVGVSHYSRSDQFRDVAKGGSAGRNLPSACRLVTEAIDRVALPLRLRHRREGQRAAWSR